MICAWSIHFIFIARFTSKWTSTKLILMAWYKSIAQIHVQNHVMASLKGKTTRKHLKYCPNNAHSYVLRTKIGTSASFSTHKIIEGSYLMTTVKYKIWWSIPAFPSKVLCITHWILIINISFPSTLQTHKPDLSFFEWHLCCAESLTITYGSWFSLVYVALTLHIWLYAIKMLWIILNILICILAREFFWSSQL